MTVLEQMPGVSDGVDATANGVMAELFTIAEVANYLKTSLRTVERRIASGELRSVKIGYFRRIPRDSLQAFIAAHQGGGGEGPKTSESAPKDALAEAVTRSGSMNGSRHGA